MQTIDQLRCKIEQTDAMIIKKIAQREKLSKRIGQLKLEQGLEVIDLSREKDLFELYGELCKKHKLPEAFILQLFTVIINHSRKIQT